MPYELSAPGKIFVLSMIVLQSVALILAFCGHGKWVENANGYSGLWKACIFYRDPITGSELDSQCDNLDARDASAEYNTGRAFFVISHFPGAGLLVTLILTIFVFSDSMAMDFIRAILSLAECGCLLLGAAIISSEKADLSKYDGDWVFGFYLTWVAWILTFILLVASILFIIIKPSLLK